MNILLIGTDFKSTLTIPTCVTVTASYFCGNSMGQSSSSIRFFGEERRAESVFDLARRGQRCEDISDHHLRVAGENMNQTEQWFYWIIGLAGIYALLRLH